VSATGVALRITAAIGLMLVVAAIAYAISNGRTFLFPFLLILGFPMAAIFRRRSPPPPPSGNDPPSRMSLN
jgi:hypothetical protein